jgi:hypothetical protein
MANEPQERRAQPGLLWPMAILFGTTVLTGFMLGYNDAMAEHGDPALTPWAAGLIPVALGTLALAFYLRRFGAFWRQWSPRKRRYWASLLLAGALGVVSGIVWQTGTHEHGGNILVIRSITPTVAVILSLLYVGGLAIAMILYHRSVDDHERQAYYKGALAGFCAFAFACPVWWMLERADLAPPVNAMALLVAAMIVNSIVYAWFKFR